MRKYALLFAISFTSCGHKLEGPSPEATGLVALVDLDGDDSTALTESPAVICNDQVEARLKLTGTGFAPLVEAALTSPHAVMPRLTLIDADGGRHIVPDDSADPASSRVDWLSSEEMQFDLVPADYDPLLPTGIYDIEISNYQNEGSEEPGGRIFVLDDALAVVPPPTVTATAPDLTCDAQAMQTITLTGTTFLMIQDRLPTIAVTSADDSAVYPADSVPTEDSEVCQPVGGNVPDVLVCTSLTFTVPMADLDPIAAGETPADYEIVVTNPLPANCFSADSDATLTVAPPPSVTTVVPDLICTAEEAKVITVTGTGFLDVDGVLPTVTVGTTAYTADSVNATTCADVPGPAASPGSTTAVRTCTELAFTVPIADLPAGNYDVTVTNPPPAACTSSVPVTLTVVPPPTTTSIADDLTCSADGARMLTITGTGFLSINATTLPTVNVGTQTPIGADSVAGCMDLPGSPMLDETVQTCTSLLFTLPAGSTPGLQDVTVTNPPEADCTSNAIKLLDAADPVITGIVPPSECQGAVPAQITITGTGFLTVDGMLPTATFDGNLTNVVSAMNCSALAGPPDITEVVQACTDLVIDVFSPGTLALGNHPVIITNPPTANCASAPFDFVVATPPTVTAIQPNRVCEDLPMTYTIFGSAFTLATVVELDDGMTTVNGTVTSVTPGMDQMTVDFGPLNPGLYTLTVSNDGVADGIGCDDTLPAALTVEPTPFVFFVDPPVAYNGINTQVTVFVTNINCDPDPPGVLPDDCITFLGISPAGSGLPPVALSQITYDLTKPKRVLGIVDGATTVAGSYDVFLTDGLGCMAVLPDGLQVTDTLGPVSLTAIDPTFGWTGGSTAVTVSGTGFVATPRLYLNPTFGGPGAVASALSAVAFVDATRLTAIVPAGLTFGDYDLIVVNPDGTVDVSTMDFVFTVTADPPPVITNITPGSIPKADGQVVTIAGANFCPPAASVTVGMTCRDAAGAFISFAPAVNACNASDITITVDAATAGLADGSVCVVRVTNDTNQSFGEFSAMSVTNPSGNPTTFTDRANLNVARRAPGTTAGRVTNAARYVYVIGGDDGATANAVDSIESGAVDAFGALPSGWELRDPLPVGTNRTLAGAVNLGRFIYLVGGNDGTTAVDTVLRAEILDPLRAPQINDLDFTPPPIGVGALGPGTWNYKVSALFPIGDPNNPGGESLPSDVQPVTVPDLPGVELILFWTPVPGASGYRVYRSPMPNQATGTEELIADNVPGATFTDLGGASISLEVPLRSGDLGQWSTVATMSTEREGAGVALAEDPLTPGTFYLYAVGGQDTTPAALLSYEYLDIVVDAGPGPTTGDHMVGTFATGLVDMPTARWQLGLYAVNNARASRVTGTTTLLYAVGGRATGAGGVVNQIRVAEVTAGGELGPCTNGAGCGTTWADPGPTTARAGFGAVANHNTLYAFCGANAAPDGTADSGEICGVGQTCAGGLPDPPDLVNFNSTGAINIQARYLLGTAVESATIFLIGGDGGGGVATATTESMPW